MIPILTLTVLLFLAIGFIVWRLDCNTDEDKHDRHW